MNHDRERSADRWSGIGWIVFGVVIVVHASMMETREYLGATFLTGPGLVPAMIGTAIALLGLVLFLRGRRGEVMAYFEDFDLESARRVAVALALMLIYGLGMIGTFPFVLATFLFVTAFVMVFNLPVSGTRAIAMLAVKAATTGAVTAFTVDFVFQTVFLVRLP
jgi:putative tricarboxylic transport membrane protein